MVFTPYPYPNVSTPVDLFIYPNTLIGDLWGALILVVLWIILTWSFNEYERTQNIMEAIVGSSFVVSGVSVFTAVLGLTTAYLVFYPFLLTGFSAFVLFVSRRD